tara:strand:- start:2338 stop:2946 length:609 start_codon:yes stop_codon:yes gene_type:complete
MIIHHLFPEPVCFSKLERPLTKQELKTLDKYKKETKNNLGNTITISNYILENKTLKNLKKDLHKKVIDYFNEVVCTSNSIIPYITQSWLNYTEPGQFHHRHEHSNSYVSGVFYVSADKEVDRIQFYKTAHEEIQLAVSKYNLFNATTWQYPVQTGDVLLFPPYLTHGVEKKKGTNLRITLSFNVFFKGTIGRNEEMSELVIK